MPHFARTASPRVTSIVTRRQGQAAFKPRKREAGGCASGCSSHFLDSDATAASLAEMEGKLGCTRCKARIGSYCWAGAQCSCGAWVAPAVQVVKSKVDHSIVVRRSGAAPAPSAPSVVGC